MCKDQGNPSIERPSFPWPGGFGEATLPQLGGAEAAAVEEARAELADPVGAYNALRSDIDIKSAEHTAAKPFSLRGAIGAGRTEENQKGERQETRSKR